MTKTGNAFSFPTFVKDGQCWDGWTVHCKSGVSGSACCAHTGPSLGVMPACFIRARRGFMTPAAAESDFGNEAAGRCLYFYETKTVDCEQRESECALSLFDTARNRRCTRLKLHAQACWCVRDGAGRSARSVTRRGWGRKPFVANSKFHKSSFPFPLRLPLRVGTFSAAK
jgi:hypothetical protein